MWNHDVADLVISEIKESDRLQSFIDNLRKDVIAYGGEIDCIQVTIGFNDDGEWTHQTGSNEYSGPVYHYPYWLVTEVYVDTTRAEFIQALVDQNNSFM